MTNRDTVTRALRITAVAPTVMVVCDEPDWPVWVNGRLEYVPTLPRKAH